MKKIVALLILIFTIMMTLHAQKAYSNGKDNYFFNQNNRIVKEIGSDTETTNKKEREGTYIFSKEYGIEYLIILWDDKTWDKYLMLKGWNVLTLYDKNGEPYFHGAGFDPYDEYMWRIPFFVKDEITTSSSLKEGAKIHSPENISSRIGEAWAEGAAGNGIGEKIFLHRRYLTSYAISIGYVSYSKPGLYMENSRPKKLRATYDNIHFIEIELEDTPNFQKINFDDLYSEAGWDTVILEIIEVYPGTKYTDTCINAMLGLFSQ